MELSRDPSIDAWLEAFEYTLRDLLRGLNISEEHWEAFGKFVFLDPDKRKKFSTGHVERGVTEFGYRLNMADEFIANNNLWEAVPYEKAFRDHQ